MVLETQKTYGRERDVTMRHDTKWMVGRESANALYRIMFGFFSRTVTVRKEKNEKWLSSILNFCALF